MRGLALLLLLLLSACALYKNLTGKELFPPERPAAVPGSVPAPKTASPPVAAGCFARLDRLQGFEYRRLPPRHEGVCGYDEAVRIVNIGVVMPGLGPISCPAAEALHAWVHDMLPAARTRLGSEIVRIRSFGTYACRARNGQEGAKLSEHARANAVDIAAFTLASGRTVSVKDDWNGGGDAAAFLRDAHKAGCEEFNIVIGPDDDSFHKDHIHLDMGDESYCK